MTFARIVCSKHSRFCLPLETGSYAGFDEEQLTCRQDGKAKVIQHLKSDFGYERVVMVGDGSTDLAAKPPADAFIGFGGNAVRQVVKEKADWFVMSFNDLIIELSRN